MRKIDADALNSIKFHPLPYTHITPSDADAESYKRGWNDAIDSIIENAPTIEPERKKGKWYVFSKGLKLTIYKCSECGRIVKEDTGYDVSKDYPFCHCGADMRKDQDD